jgi:hypothetical protein
MKIYKQEIVDGLKDRVLASTSLSFASKVEANRNPVVTACIQKAFAGKLTASEGLYPTKSILVSTVWNLNDDVFDKGEAWIARATPEDKPTNLGHDEKQIVGHITGNWPITTEGNLIDPETPIDELPDVYHIVNSAVIYTLWQDKDLAQRTATLIEEIEAGKKFVSMECTFCGFDYAIIGPNKKYHIVARSSESAYLTKHLRAYGGTGEFQGHKIGRLLRNITFSGKGYVDEPANPDSIILKGEDFSFANIAKENPTFLIDSGVLFLQANIEKEHDKMSEILEKQIADLTKKFTDSEVARSKFETELKTATDKIAELAKSNEDSKTELKSLNDKLVAEVAKSGELAKALEDTNKAKAESDKELATIKADQAKAKRIAKLVEGGVAKDVAETKAVAFVNFSDEQFDIVAEALIVAAKAAKVEEDVDVDPAGEAAAKAAAEAAEKAKAEADKKTILNPPVEEDKKLETVRASISEYLQAQLGVK